MEIIANASKTVLSILKTFKKNADNYRMIHYCVQTSVPGGMLLFNTLTRELVLLSEEEYSRAMELEYLKAQWFVVPEDTKEMEIADFIKLFLKTRQKKTSEITHYTIFPTTDCNARCFYCFELGRSRIPMSIETAEKVAKYIADHCDGKPVSIAWFGGEPLFNQPAIDTICAGLHRQGIAFTSVMASNGYLFDDQAVKKAVEDWNLKRIQITLDGTQKVYNRVKAYVYRDTNPYQTVLQNIEKLLDASIKVVIRLNMDLYNADDLLELIQELAQRFGGREKIAAYAYHLFDGERPLAETHSAEEWVKRGEAMRRLEETIERNGLGSKRGISKEIKMSHCIADNNHAVTILPDGNIGLCEQYSESEFIGHIDREGFDADVVASWKVTSDKIPECAGCFYYLDCVKLKKCANQNVCFLQYRQECYRQIQRQMLCEYKQWMTQTPSEESEQFGNC